MCLNCHIFQLLQNWVGGEDMIYWVSLLSHKQAILPHSPIFWLYVIPNICLVIHLKKSPCHYLTWTGRVHLQFAECISGAAMVNPKLLTLGYCIQRLCKTSSLSCHSEATVPKAKYLFTRRKIWPCWLSVIVFAHYHNPKGKEAKMNHRKEAFSHPSGNCGFHPLDKALTPRWIYGTIFTEGINVTSLLSPKGCREQENKILSLKELLLWSRSDA